MLPTFRIPASAEEDAAVRAQQATLFTGPPTRLGLTLYVHGGGFQFTLPAHEEVMAFRLGQATGRPAVRVDYRLAPAHPYPAAVDDVVAAYRRVVAAGTSPANVLLAGESAGGTLLLSALLVLAAAGDELPGGAIAVSPVTDLAAKDPSAQADDVIDPTTMDPIVAQYLAGARPDQAPQSPFYGDLGVLPPLLLCVGADEVLLDDVVRFARAADAVGGDVTLDVYEHMPHAFHAGLLAPDADLLPTARTFLDRTRQWVNSLAEPGR